MAIFTDGHMDTTDSIVLGIVIVAAVIIVAFHIQICICACKPKQEQPLAVQLLDKS